MPLGVMPAATGTLILTVPFVGCPGPPASERPGEERPEPLAPESDGLVADLHPAFRQQFLDVPVAQGEPLAQPRRVAVLAAGKR